MTGTPALFLDRDGVINEELSYITSPDQISLIKGAGAAIRAVNAAAIPVIVVTNQSAVARGLISERELADIHRHLRALLAAEGAKLDDILYSPYLPDADDPRYRRDSDCRKPGPGMLLAAARQHGLDLADSVMIGDSLRDVAAARAAGLAAAYIVRTGHGAAEVAHLASLPADSRDPCLEPDAVFRDIAEAVQYFLHMKH